jgi:pimeloyl-ACP methyl ester carboxylesterase
VVATTRQTQEQLMIVSSSGGVDVAVHDLAGHDAALPVCLIAHATGFHGRCYQPLAEVLATRFHSIAFDARGHGDSPLPANGILEWSSYADDTEAVALSLSRPLRAFGHSMGGACLLMVAHRHPGLFSRLVVYEPIVFPPLGDRNDENPIPLVEGARRRRNAFASFDAALANFASKPPLSRFTPAALDAYVTHGFRQGEDGQVHLKCLPETEAVTFELGATHRTWDLLPEIDIPVLVLSGPPSPNSPSRIAGAVADRLPNGRHIQLDDLDHFGPMTHPALIAELVADAI